jgi:hypothetical protein
MTNIDRQELVAAADECAAKHGVTMELDIRDDGGSRSDIQPVQRVALQVTRTIPGELPRTYASAFDHPVSGSDLLAHIEREIETGARELFRAA